MSWTIIYDYNEHEKALSLAKGSYQRDILYGNHAISGSTLKGRAKNYSSKYKSSIENLFARMEKAGIFYKVIIGKHNKKILQIGRSEEDKLEALL